MINKIQTLSKLTACKHLQTPSSEVAKMGFWSKKFNNILKPMEKQFLDFRDFLCFEKLVLVLVYKYKY